jgi:hypothetical protein
MEYKGFDALLNKYPNRESYKKDSLETIVLKGVYPQNQLEFEIPPLEEIEVVDDTQFRFVIALRQSRDDVDIIGLYTSPIFITEMVTSVNENTPYFTQNGVNPQFLVSFYINEIIPIYNSFFQYEKDSGVDIERNIFIKNNGEYKYDEIIKYIDWVVSKPSLDERGVNTVLPVYKISNYKFKPFDTENNIFEDIGSELNNSKINNLVRELNDINNIIDEYEEFIQNPGKVRLLPDSRIAKIVGLTGVTAINAASGALLASITSGATLGSIIGPLGTIIGTGVGGVVGIVRTLVKAKKNKSKQQIELQESINKIKEELIQLKERRTNIENELKTLR